jgi:hypothetical protein
VRKRALHKPKGDKDLRRETVVSLVRAPRGNETAGGERGRQAARAPATQDTLPSQVVWPPGEWRSGELASKSYLRKVLRSPLGRK